jgi:hypothetical protein
MTNRKMIDYRVRIQVAEDSPDGVLLNFLKHGRHPSFSHKEMVLWALRGYWMAIAFRQYQNERENGMVSAQMRQIALDGMHQLRQQMAYIQSVFEFEQVGQGAGKGVVMANGLMQSGLDNSGMCEQIGVELSGELSSSTVSSAVALEKQRENEWYGGEDLFDSSL